MMIFFFLVLEYVEKGNSPSQWSLTHQSDDVGFFDLRYAWHTFILSLRVCERVFTPAPRSVLTTGLARKSSHLAPLRKRSASAPCCPIPRGSCSSTAPDDE